MEISGEMKKGADSPCALTTAPRGVALMESVIESLFNHTFENNTWSLIGAYSTVCKIHIGI